MLAIGKVKYVLKKQEDNRIRHFLVLDTGLACVFETRKPLKLKGRTVKVEGLPFRDRKGRIILKVSRLSFLEGFRKGRVYLKGKVIKRFLSYSDEEKTRELLLIEDENGKKIPVEAWNAPSGRSLSIEGYIKDDIVSGQIVKALKVQQI